LSTALRADVVGTTGANSLPSEVAADSVLVSCLMNCSATDNRPVRLAYPPPANSTFLSKQISHQQPASSTFLSEQISTSHQQPAKRTG
jgi:hypothetical protein